jgi:catechol 2,3-dioxygenase-like lactoylglutathione lyase family enzyme
LRPVAQGPGFCFLRATGPDHHVLALRERPAPMLIRIDFAAASPRAVQKLHGELKASGVAIRAEPGPVADPGGGYGFDFADPAGREFRILSDAAVHVDAPDLPDRPRKLSHVVLNSTDADADAAFFQDVLDFRLSDQTAMMEFLRCNADHHSIAFVRSGSVSLNHAAFEMPDWDAVMRGAGRMKEAGHELQWGIGRHGPGNNVFAYYIDPDGMVIEYTAELQRIDEVLHRPGKPQDWDRPLNRLDQWGYAGAPSEKILNAMNGAGQA